MTITCRGQLIDLNSPKIMGILNLTPDSFYDGGKYKNENDILKQTENMLDEGATFIDIGGQSSRPGADFLSVEEELNRVLPVVELLLREFPETLISIDTFQSQVAKHTVEAGAALVNDISAGNLDENMMETVAELQVPYIMMHMKGTPKTMQSKTNYGNMLQEILYYFSEKIRIARELGLNDVIIDPGFGFSKTRKQNFEVLCKTDLFKTLELPILMGVSRKSTICKTLNVQPADALNGTTVLNTIALQNGVNILRVHDVREAWECVELVGQVNA